MGRLVVLAAALLIDYQIGCECGPSSTALDASGDLDAGDLSDAGSIDAGSIDAGSGDAGSGDAGSGDAGSGDAGGGDAGGGDAGGGDAGSGDAGGSDAGSGDAGSGDAGGSDAGSGDAGGSDAGSGAVVVWRLVNSSSNLAYYGSDASVVSVTNPVPVITGDLVVMGCDMDGRSDIAATTSSALPLSTIGPFTTPSSNNLLTRVWWGVATSDLASLQSTFTRVGQWQFLDCVANVYRSDVPSAPVLVDSRFTAAVGDGTIPRVTCGPVDTVRGGVVFYISVIWGACYGPPTNGFTQRAELQGNPNGDLWPADGGLISTEVGGCEVTSQDYSCLIASFGH